MNPSKKDETLGERILRLELERKADRERDDMRDKLLREIHKEIVGEGESPGLRGRVDRLERSAKGLKYVLGLVVSVVGLLSGFKLFDGK